MSLYSLLNNSRYTGCTDSRLLCACFNKQEALSLSLFCEETEDGLQLMLRVRDDVMPATLFSLPDYVTERIVFWNTWASDEFLYQYDRMESALYGLEAYSISIAADISAAYPSYYVDYCGFPVHDEWAVREYAEQHCGRELHWDEKFPPIPSEWGYNRAMKELIGAVTSKKCIKSTSCFVLRHDLDWGISNFHYDPAVLPVRWLGYEESFGPDVEGGFPSWLVEQFERMEIMHDIELEHVFDFQAPSVWQASDYIQPFLFDALSVDILRYHTPIVPISSSERYVTGRALLELVRKLREKL